MRRSFIVGGLIFSCALAAHAQAPSAMLQPDQIIAIRQAVMDLQQGSAAALKAAVDDKADVKPLAATAKGLVASSKVIPTLFPAGTEKGHNTKALAAIWSNPSGFAKNASDLNAAAEKLVTLANANDKAGFATQFTEMGRVCGTCHREFREKQ